MDFSSAFNTIVPDLLSDKPTQLSVPTSICPDRQAATGETRQSHIQNFHHQHWRPSELRSLPTALLPLHKWLHFKGHLCQAPEFCGWHYSHRPHQGRRRVCLQTGGGAAGCLVQSYQPATGAAETVLLCHHRNCPVFIYSCLVWFSYQNRHQKTTTDSQDCWEDYLCPFTQPPRSLYLQNEEKG